MKLNAHIARNIARLTILALAMLAPLGVCAPAAAQGTFGQLADPITSAELSTLLTVYARASTDALAKVEALHDTYRERFKALREGDMEKFLERMRTMQGGMPSKEQMEELTRGYEKVNKQVAEVDDALFAAIAEQMGEAHAANVKRAQDARTRRRSATGIMRGITGNQQAVELAPLVNGLGLDAKQLETIDPLLVSYEARATAMCKELSQLEARTIRDMFDELEKRGFGNMTNEDFATDPEKAREMMGAMQEAMQKATAKMRAKAADLTELSTASHRQVSEQLTGMAKRKFRTRYLKEIMPQWSEDPAGAERTFLRALRFKSLDDASRERVTQAYAQWQAADDPLVDQAVGLTAKMYESMISRAFGSEGEDDPMKALMTLRERRLEVAQKAIAPLVEIVGQSRIDKLNALVVASKGDIFDETGDPEGEQNAEAVAAAQEQQEAQAKVQRSYEVLGDRSPISKQSIAAIATHMALDDARKSVLDALYADFEKKWNDSVAPLRTRMDEAAGKMWVHDADGSASMNNEQQAAYYSTRKEIQSKVTQLEDALFSDVRSALGDDAKFAVDLARLGRLVERGGTGNQYSMWGAWGSEEQLVNMAEVLLTETLTADDMTKLATTLSPQMDALIKIQAEGSAASLEAERKMQEWSVRNMGLYKEGQTPDAAEMQRVNNEMMALNRTISQEREKRLQALSGAWKSALAALPEERRATLQLAYNTRAYPSVYKDRLSALPYLTKAADLPDLTADQRQQLTALSEKYRTQHMEYCQKMVPTKTVEPPSDPADQQAQQRYWQEQMAQMNARERVRFERDEASQRTVSQLKRLLSAEQIQRLAGLADYEKAASAKGTGQFGQMLE